MKTKVFMSLLGLIGLFTHAIGQNDSVPNFFEIKARWEERLSELSGLENEYGETDEEMEDGELANFNRWIALWQYRLGPNGDMTTANEAMNDFQRNRLLSNTTRNLMTCDPLDDDNIYWTNLGPLNSQGATSGGYCGSALNHQNQGRIESISVNPAYPDDIVIGAYNGGIWRKQNINANWTNTTDDEGYSIYGASSLVRHPANSDIIYASTSGKGGNFGGVLFPYGLGVIMSLDGGTSWQITGLTYPNFGTWNSSINKLEIDPNSTLVNTILYAFSGSDVWKWQGDQFANGAWTSIWQDPISYKGALWYDYINTQGDMECAPNGDVWFSNCLGLYKIPNGSNTASLINNYSIPPNYVNLTTSCGQSAQILRQDISIDINQQGHIVFHCKFTKCGPPNEETYFYKSVDNGNTWTRVDDPAHGHTPQQFVVNPQNSNMIYAENSGRCMYKYTFDFTQGTLINSSNMTGNENHVDVRTLLAFSGNLPDGTDNVLFVGTDGGISKTINGNVWSDITGQGLSITNYYGVGITETNDKLILTGAQDGSNNYYNNGNFFQTPPGGDNGDCLINSPGNTIVLQESNDGVSGGGLEQGNLIGSSYTFSNSFIATGDLTDPLCWNPSVSNEFFIGTKKCYLGTLSNPSLTPIYDPLLHAERRISSVASSRNNPNVVYYSIGAGTVDDGIYKGTRSMPMGPWTVTDITEVNPPNPNGLTNAVLIAPITDIAVDPNDENRIWVSFGGYQSGHKVYFTGDGGNNWQNITSNCLPNLPVTSLVFQEMSNDRVYIGTDNGVYYRDNIQTDWAYYGNNGPQCIVNDLEINQCAGKLVAATYGRGLWEAPLITGPENTIPVGVTNWTIPRTIAANLRIVNGATLNINNTTINIGQGVKIMIEPGGKLQITGSTLTNNCGYVWDGIKVWGNSSLIQNSTNQGTLIIDNSTIEHATEAIEVIKDGDVTTTGGIVKADNSNFLNNKRSVAYYQYLTSINQGHFYNCLFKTDANYRHSASLLSHVSLWAVDGCRLWGCRFETNNSWPFDEIRVQAITALDANFTVNAYCAGVSLPCGTPEIRSKFIGFNKAVNTSRTTGSYTFSVLESDFQNNVFGVITSGHNNFGVRDCTFRVGKTDAAGAPTAHEGIVIMSGTGFNVDQNTFWPTFTSTTPITIGIRAKDTGSEVNQIYKNSFIKFSPTDENIFFGNLANGLNRNTSNVSNGLKYYCNTNVNNKKNGLDFAVTDEGIAFLQGSLTYPAKNYFSLGTQLTGAPPGSDFNNGASTGNIRYFHNPPSPQEPLRIIAVSKFPIANTDNTCPDHYDDGEVDPRSSLRSINPLEEYSQIAQQFISIKNDLADHLVKLNNLMDDGNKPFLIGQIQNLKSGTKGVLLDQLLGIAPFVSLEVMEVLLSKVGNPLTKSEFKEIALANPDVFVNNLFVTECIQNGLLSQAEMNDLQIRVTDRTILENEISELYAAKYSTCNEAISIIVGNPELFSKEEIVIWLDNKNSLFSDMAIVDYLINQLNFSEARTLLNKLSEKYQLSFDEQEELDNFIQIKELQITLKKENIAIDKLSLQLIEILEPIAINGKGLAGDQVRTILNQNGGKYFVPPVFPKKGGFEEEVSEIRANIENNLVSFDSENNLLLAKPNPASSEIIFSYKLQESKPCVIIVRDHIGTVITELTVNDSFGAITWNCTNSKPGVYFYSLETIGQLLIEPKRILILR